jgi:hypothetical protein
MCAKIFEVEMLGFRLFWHAVRMVFTNLVPMVQIFALPLLVVMAVVMAFSTYSGVGPFFFLSGQNVRFDNMSGGFLVVFFCTLLVIWIALMNGVVHWHRYILLEETPRTLMLRLSWRQAAKYIVGGILIGLLLILPFWLLGMVFGKIAMELLRNGNILVARGIMIVLSLFFTAGFLALSPILPANAIDRNITISAALSAMSGSLGTLIVCAIGLGAVEWTGDVLVRQLAMLNMQVAGLVGIVVQMLLAMIGVSLITTIYGHFVEERPLD